MAEQPWTRGRSGGTVALGGGDKHQREKVSLPVHELRQCSGLAGENVGGNSLILIAELRSSERYKTDAFTDSRERPANPRKRQDMGPCRHIRRLRRI